MGVKVFKAYNMDKFEEKEYYMEIGLGRTWSLRGRLASLETALEFFWKVDDLSYAAFR